MNTDEVIELLAKAIIRIKRINPDKPIVVAFDGVDTSGKTSLADGIQLFFQNQTIESIRVSIDKFHNAKETRLSKGEYSPVGFFYDSFNYEKILELVLNPIKNRASLIVKGIYDYRVEDGIAADSAKITKDSIILFDGIFMNRDELRGYWDLSIFLDVSFETVRKRAVLRDTKLFGTEEEALNKYDKRYIPGEELYIASCNPKDRADIVIDNNDWQHPVITKGLPSHSRTASNRRETDRPRTR